jgi:hypothetical protein
VEGERHTHDFEEGRGCERHTKKKEKKKKKKKEKKVKKEKKKDKACARLSCYHIPKCTLTEKKKR